MTDQLTHIVCRIARTAEFYARFMYINDYGAYMWSRDAKEATLYSPYKARLLCVKQGFSHPSWDFRVEKVDKHGNITLNGRTIRVVPKLQVFKDDHGLGARFA